MSSSLLSLAFVCLCVVGVFVPIPVSVSGLDLSANNLHLRQVYSYVGQGEAASAATFLNALLPPAYDMCTDDAGRVFFIAESLTALEASPRIGRLDALPAIQFDESQTIGATTPYMVARDVFTTQTSDQAMYPSGANPRYASRFTPAGLACGPTGDLMLMDYQAWYDIADGFKFKANPAFLHLQGEGTNAANGEMTIVSATEGKTLRDPTETDMPTQFVWDTVRSELIYAVNCVNYGSMPMSQTDVDERITRPNCGNPIASTEEQFDLTSNIAYGSYFGRYIQPGVTGAVRPVDMGVTEIKSAQSKNPNANFNDAQLAGATAPLESVLPSGAVKIGAVVTDYFRTFFAYDLQRRQAYFGGRFNNIGEAAPTKPDMTSPADGTLVTDLSTNPETQNAIWMQSMATEHDQRNVHQPKMIYRAENDRDGVAFTGASQVKQQFQAVALAPNGDLYFCDKVVPAGTMPIIYYFTASDLRTREASTTLLTTQPQTLTYTQSTRSTASTLEDVSGVSQCASLTFDPLGNLFIADSKNIFVVSNLNAPTAVGTFYSLPVVVEIFGKVVEPRTGSLA